MSWSRRIGLAAALVLLVGGSIAFAGQTLDLSGLRPRPNAPPPPAPNVLAPATTLTRGSSASLTVIRPEGLRQDQGYLVRVYVNGVAALERDLPDGERLTLDDVPLEQGDNEIRVALVGSAGEGPRSVAVAVRRDDVAPVIRISRPDAAAALYEAEALLAGRTEPGADLVVTRVPGGDRIETAVQPDGGFQATLRLDYGENELLLRSRDQAGNVARTRIVLVRAESAASLTLTLSPTEVDASLLPAAVQLVARVQDEQGRPVDDAEITFALSPPNQPTITHRTTTRGGLAVWSDVELPATADSRGTWLATALAILPSGEELREDESLSVR